MPRKRQRKVRKIIDPDGPAWPPPIEYTANGGPWSEWWQVMERARVEGAHPSREYLDYLIANKGIPEYARSYVEARATEGPGAKPPTPPMDWGLFGVFRADEAAALMDLVNLTATLAAYETTEAGKNHVNTWRRSIQVDCLLSGSDEPVTMEVTLTRVGRVARRKKTGGWWRVRDAKRQARQIVAIRHGISTGQLQALEQKFRESDTWLGEAF